jgi:hypothetical protein
VIRILGGPKPQITVTSGHLGCRRISGNVIASGAPEATVNGDPGQGTVYLFTKPAGGWHDGIRATKLTASDGLLFQLFGNSAAMPGHAIMIGTDSPALGGNSGLGAAYLFVRPPGGWHDMTQTAELTPFPDTRYWPRLLRRDLRADRPGRRDQRPDLCLRRAPGAGATRPSALS